MNIIKYLFKRSYRAHYRRSRARDLVCRKKEIVRKLVRIEDVYTRCNEGYMTHSYLTIDGIRLLQVSDETRANYDAYLELIRDRYYRRYKRTISDRFECYEQ